MRIDFKSLSTVDFGTLNPGDVFYDAEASEYCMVINDISKHNAAVYLSSGFVQQYGPLELVVYPIDYSFTVKELKYEN